jgi:hypothetical protein
VVGGPGFALRGGGEGLSLLRKREWSVERRKSKFGVGRSEIEREKGGLCVWRVRGGFASVGSL